MSAGHIPQLIVALDTKGPKEALAMAEKLRPYLNWVKVGPVVLSAKDTSVLESLKEMGYSVFVDLKFHDIPHTVGAAVDRWVERGADFLTVHASGGRKMLEEAHRRASKGGTEILAVTVLTSLGEDDLKEMQWGKPQSTPGDQVLVLAKLSLESGCRGIVCSLREAPLLRKALGNKALLVCPGLRLPGALLDDQNRTASPQEAARSGADYLVVGRPVIEASDPEAVVQELNGILKREEV